MMHSFPFNIQDISSSENIHPVSNKLLDKAPEMNCSFGFKGGLGEKLTEVE